MAEFALFRIMALIKSHIRLELGLRIWRSFTCRVGTDSSCCAVVAFSSGAVISLSCDAVISPFCGVSCILICQRVPRVFSHNMPSEIFGT
jgi:hypothetical protein